ncbi:MAG: radical SAM protein [Candidatus Rokubacteria bacterium]|nr:radical SAM protein [Candidatus Rokubacteria bacterium]
MTDSRSYNPRLRYNGEMAEGFMEGSLSFLRPEVIRSHASPEFPLFLNIDPTNACELRCEYCPTKYRARPWGFMDLELFRRVIDEVTDRPQLFMLNLHKDGEPLLHRRLHEMIRYAKDRKVARMIHMNTNGVSLSREKALRLLDSGIDDITFSVDAASRETYAATKGRDKLHQVEENVRTFMALRTQRGQAHPFVRAKILEYSGTRREIEGFVARWSSIVDEVQVTGVHDWSGSIDVSVTEFQAPRRYPCVFLWYALAVNWDGQVSLCCVDWNLSAVVGDVRESSLHEIWTGPKVREARRLHVEQRFREVPLCHKCTVWSGGPDMGEWPARAREFL